MTPQTHLHNSGIPDNEVAWFPRIFLEDSAPDASDHGPDATDCEGAREGRGRSSLVPFAVNHRTGVDRDTPASGVLTLLCKRRSITTLLGAVFGNYFFKQDTCSMATKGGER